MRGSRNPRKSRKPLPEQTKFLPPDLWREILLRSSVKTLLRFRCVCKTWCSFIDSSDFISTHLKIYKNNCANAYLLFAERVPNTLCGINIIVRHSDTIRKAAQLVTFRASNLFMEIDMVNGLLLTMRFNLQRSKIVELNLWNPCIRKSVLLPQCPLIPKLDNVERRRFHLGFDPSGNNYKVVSFELGDHTASELSIAIAIYSLRDHCWRVKPSWTNVPRWCFELIDHNKDEVIFSQGAWYWKPHPRFQVEETHILSFDFVSEEFSYVKMPDIGKEMLRFIFFLGGSLAVFGISRVRACVWVMEKNRGEDPWRLFSSGDSNLNGYTDFTCEGLKVMYIENTGILLVHTYNKLIFYNITSHRVQQRKNFRSFNLGTYVESLVLHKGYEGATLTSLTNQNQYIYNGGY